MKNITTRSLFGLSLALILAPQALSASIGSTTVASAPTGARTLIDTTDVAMLTNQPNRQRGRIVTDLEDVEVASATASSTIRSGEIDPALEIAAPEAEQQWILGALGAVCLLGLGITFAGVYWSGPRCFTRW